MKVIFRDLAKYLPAQIVPGIVGFFSVPILTNLFDAEDYGKYSLAKSIIRILLVVVSWVSISVIRLYPEYEKKGLEKTLVGVSFYLHVVSCLVASMALLGVGFVFGYQGQQSLSKMLLFALPSFALSSVFLLQLEVLRAKRQIMHYSLSKNWESIAAIAMGLFFAKVIDFGVIGLFVGSALCYFIGVVALWVPSFSGDTQWGIGSSRQTLKEISRYGFPAAVSNIAAWVLSLSDRYIINITRGAREVGIYAASYGLSEYSLILVATLFGLTSGSLVFNIYEHSGEASAKEFISKICRYYIIIGLPIALGLGSIAKPLIILLTGEEFHPGYRIVPIVTIGTFFLGLQQRFHAGINIAKKNILITVSVFTAGFCNIVLNMIFVPKYGYMAAAYTTLFSYLTLFLLVALLSRNHFTWPFPIRSTIVAVVSSMIMCAAVLGVVRLIEPSTIWMLLIVIFVGIIVYACLLLLFREFKIADLQHALKGS